MDPIQVRDLHFDFVRGWSFADNFERDDNATCFICLFIQADDFNVELFICVITCW